MLVSYTMITNVIIFISLMDPAVTSLTRCSTKGALNAINKSQFKTTHSAQRTQKHLHMLVTVYLAHYIYPI